MPPGANRRHPDAQHGDESGNPSLANRTDKSPFAALTDRELLEAIHPDTVAAEQRGYDAGFRDGYLRGALFAKGECVRDHGSIPGRIDAAARAFYRLEADEAHRRAGVGA